MGEKSFVQLINEFLSKNGPMHYKKLTEEILKIKTTKGKTPDQTILAILSQNKNKYEKVSDGVYSLAAQKPTETPATSIPVAGAMADRLQDQARNAPVTANPNAQAATQLVMQSLEQPPPAEQKTEMTEEAVDEAVTRALGHIARDYIPKQAGTIYHKEGRAAALKFLSAQLRNCGGTGPNMLAFEGTPKGLKISPDYGSRGRIIAYPVILDEYVLKTKDLKIGAPPQGPKPLLSVECQKSTSETPIKFTIPGFVDRLLEEYATKKGLSKAGVTRLKRSKAALVKQLKGKSRERLSLLEAKAEDLYGRRLGLIETFLGTHYLYPAETVSYASPVPDWFREGKTKLGLDEGLKEVSVAEQEADIAKKKVDIVIEELEQNCFLNGDPTTDYSKNLVDLKKAFDENAVKCGVPPRKFQEVLDSTKEAHLLEVFKRSQEFADDRLEDVEGELLKLDWVYDSKSKTSMAEAKANLKEARTLIAQAEAAGSALGRAIKSGLRADYDRLSRILGEIKVEFILALHGFNYGDPFLAYTGDGFVHMLDDYGFEAGSVARFPSMKEATSHIKNVVKLIQDRYVSGFRQRGKIGILEVKLIPEPVLSELRSVAMKDQIRGLLR